MNDRKIQKTKIVEKKLNNFHSYFSVPHFSVEGFVPLRRIITAGVPGIAAADPPDPPPHAAKGTVLPHGGDENTLQEG